MKQLTDVFCKGQQPALREAIFLAIWAVHYTINTVSGGVGEPIRVAVLDQDKARAWAARELTANDIQEHENGIDAAYDALRNWRDSFHSEEAEEDLPAKPEPPKGGI